MRRLGSGARTGWGRVPVGLATLAVLFLIMARPAWAWEPKVRVSQGGRVNLRASRPHIPNETIGRLEMDLFSEEQSRWSALPFLEGRRDLDGGGWSRVESGAEVGARLFPWLYVGSSLHQAWITPGRDHPEWEIRSVVHRPLPWTIRSERLGLYAVNEYSYDLRAGEGIRNEIASGLKIPLPFSRLSVGLGWRHVDLIHGDDMDQFEGFLQAGF